MEFFFVCARFGCLMKIVSYVSLDNGERSCGRRKIDEKLTFVCNINLWNRKRTKKQGKESKDLFINDLRN